MNRRYINPRYVKRADDEGAELRAKKFELEKGFPLSWVEPTYFGEMPGEYPKTYVELNGNVVKIRHIQRPVTNMPGKRSEITELTKKSRKRLLEFLASISWHKLNPRSINVVTLTYHNDYPEDGQEVKRQFHNFRRDLTNEYPGVIIIWKLEFQEREAPHFHLIVITEKPEELGNYMILKNNKLQYFDRDKKEVLKEGTKGLRYFIQKSWNKHTHESIEHFNSGTEVEEVRSATGLPYYLTKYIAGETKFESNQHNVPEWFKNVGRWWGCYNRSALKIKKRRITISSETKDKLIENVKRFWSDNEMPEYKIHDFGVNMYALDKMDVQKYIWDTILDNPEKTYN